MGSSKCLFPDQRAHWAHARDSVNGLVHMGFIHAYHHGQGRSSRVFRSLLTSWQDNRSIIWDPKAENIQDSIVMELAPTPSWTFDVQWCPRTPGIVATAGFDNHLAIHTMHQPVSKNKLRCQSASIHSSPVPLVPHRDLPCELQRSRFDLFFTH